MADLFDTSGLAKAQVVPTVKVADLIEIKRRLSRTVICHTSHAAALEAEVEAEGLSKVVTIVGTEYLPVDVAYVIANSVLEIPPAGSLGPIPYTREWLDQWDRFRE